MLSVRRRLMVCPSESFEAADGDNDMDAAAKETLE